MSKLRKVGYTEQLLKYVKYPRHDVDKFYYIRFYHDNHGKEQMVPGDYIFTFIFK